MAAAAGPGHLRASHADREQVIGTLKAAFVQGMLAKDEFDARMGQAFASRTYAELAVLTADLRAMPPAAQPPEPSRPRGRQPVLRPGRWIAVATVLYAGAWWYALFLSRHGGDDQWAFPLIVGGFFAYLGVVIASVGAIIVNRRDEHSGGQSPRRPAPGASRQASGRLPSAGPGGELPSAGSGQQQSAEAAPGRHHRPKLSSLWPPLGGHPLGLRYAIGYPALTRPAAPPSRLTASQCRSSQRLPGPVLVAELRYLS